MSTSKRQNIAGGYKQESQQLRVANNSRGFLLHSLWIINCYVKCLSNNLINENINPFVSREMLFEK